MINEEATNTAQKVIMTIRPWLLIVYLIIWALCLGAFYFIKDDSGMGYAILVFYITIPVFTFVVSFLFGAFDYGGKLKWLWPIFFGSMYMVLEYATFKLGHSVAYGNNYSLDKGDFMMIVNGLIISAFAIIVGHIVFLTGIRKLDLIKTKNTKN